MISHFNPQLANLSFGNADENLVEFILGFRDGSPYRWLLLFGLCGCSRSPGPCCACPAARCARFTVCLCTDSPGAGLGAEPHDSPPCLPEKPILPYIRNAAEGGLIKITALFFPKDNVLGRSSWRYRLPVSKATKIKEPWKPPPKAQIEACFHPALFWRQLNVCFWFLAVHDTGGWEEGSVS